MYTVYKHTTPSGKVYIGITSMQPEKRWESGSGYKQNKHFYYAILKYGWENIKHEIVCTGLSKWQACRVEQSLIKYFDSTNNSKGYNHSIGGECGSLGVHPSEDTRKKLRKAHKGKRPSDECIRKSVEAHKGKHLDIETRMKISKKLKGQSLSIETRKKMSEARKGRKISKHVILAMTEATSKKVLCAETGEVYKSLSEAGRQLGISFKNISNVLRGKSKTAGGYHWRYADAYEEQIQREENNR